MSCPAPDGFSQGHPAHVRPEQQETASWMWGAEGARPCLLWRGMLRISTYILQKGPLCKRAFGFFPGWGGRPGFGRCSYLRGEVEETKQSWGRLTMGSRRWGRWGWGLSSGRGLGMWLKRVRQSWRKPRVIQGYSLKDEEGETASSPSPLSCAKAGPLQLPCTERPGPAAPEDVPRLRSGCSLCSAPVGRLVLHTHPGRMGQGWDYSCSSFPACTP